MTQRYVGQAMKRKEDPRLVSGTSTYVDDVVLPGMLYMAVTRSMHAHARIKRVDTSKAQKLPGVVAVVTGEEVAAHCGLIPCAASLPNMKKALRPLLATRTGSVPARRRLRATLRADADRSRSPRERGAPPAAGA